MTWSVVGTLVPLAVSASYLLTDGSSNTHGTLAAVGMLVAPLGPSLGHFYAGATGRALLGLGIRLAGLAGMVGGSYGLDNGDANQDLHNLKAEKLQVALAPLVSPRTKVLGLQARLSF